MDQPLRRSPENSPPPSNRQPPLIIYEADPKIHRVDPSGFMSLVQKLTGPPMPPSEINMATTQQTTTGYGHSTRGQPPGPAGSSEPGPSTFSLPPQEPNPYMGVHRRQQYPFYDTISANNVASSSSNALISDDEFPYDYFTSELYQRQHDGNR